MTGNGKKVRKAGRPKKLLTGEQMRQVETLAAVLTMRQMADFFGIHEVTLWRRFQEDETIMQAYQRGKAKAVAGVASNLMTQAREGNVTAAIFFLKTQGGWKETTAHELQGPGGAALPVEVRFVLPPGHGQQEQGQLTQGEGGSDEGTE
jgi:hypothetical protein